MDLKLRPYQARLIDCTLKHLQEYPESQPLIVSPTASGKSVIVAKLCEQLAERSDGMVLVLTHRKELVEQNHAKLPHHLKAGIYSASLGKKQLNPITIAGFQSIRNQTAKLPRVSYILIDEAHYAAKGYREFIETLKERSPNLRVIGLTATPFDGSANRTALHLLPADKAIFTGVAAEVGVGELLRDNYLTKLTPYRGKTQLSTAGVGIDNRQGDFAIGQLQAAVDVDDTNRKVAEEITDIFSERNAVMVFCTGVEHCLHVAEQLRLLGGEAECVLGSTLSKERDTIIARFRAGKLKYLVACEVLLVGFDAPICDGIANLRPTKSGLIWVQLCGRGMRLFDGKHDCLATGQRVLTDKGLVPIEQIDTSMKVWDGIEFVTHHGVIYKGEQDVIEYAGIIGTPDHKVWTEEGWRTLRQCRTEQTPIAVTGDGRGCVKQSDNRFRGGSANQQAPVSGNPLQHLWKTCAESVMHIAQRVGGLRPLRKSCDIETQHPEVVVGEGERGIGTVSQPKTAALSRLRGAWDKISLFWASGYGCLGSGESWFAPAFRVESNRQRWALRTGESRVLHAEDQCKQQSIYAGNGEHAQVQTCLPGNQVRRRHTCQVDSYGDERSGNHREVSQEIVQTKRGVWDILNAGPRHRFTCEGLLVSNCLVADFTETSIELGPIDEISGNPPRLKTGETPTKMCDDCYNIILAGLRICPVCGHEFPPGEARPGHNFDPVTGMLVSGIIRNEDGSKTYPVSHVDYEIRNTAAGAPALVAHYMSEGRQSPVGVDWFNMWHHKSSVSQRDSAKWLRRQVNADGPIPMTAQEALFRAQMNALKTPSSVTVKPGSPFPIRFGAPK